MIERSRLHDHTEILRKLLVSGLQESLNFGFRHQPFEEAGRDDEDQDQHAFPVGYLQFLNAQGGCNTPLTIQEGPQSFVPVGNQHLENRRQSPKR